MILNSEGAGSITRTVEDEFFDLVYGDQELLRAEFDAIIAAGWPGVPPTQPTPAAAASGPVGWEALRAPAGDARHKTEFALPKISDQARQRSPPHARGATTRKAGDRLIS